MLHHLLPSCTLPLQSPHQGAWLGMLKHLHSHHLRLQEHTTNGPSTFWCHHPTPRKDTTTSAKTALLVHNVGHDIFTALCQCHQPVGKCITIIAYSHRTSKDWHLLSSRMSVTTLLLPCVHVFILSGTTSSSHMCRASEACRPLFMMPVATLLLPLSHPTPHTHCLELAWPQGGVHLPIKLSAVPSEGVGSWNVYQLSLAACCCLADHSKLTVGTAWCAVGEGKACCVGSTGGPVAIHPSAAQSVSPAAFLHEFELPS